MWHFFYESVAWLYKLNTFKFYFLNGDAFKGTQLCASRSYICLQNWKLQVVMCNHSKRGMSHLLGTKTVVCWVVLCFIPVVFVFLLSVCEERKYCKDFMHAQWHVGYKWMNPPPFPEWGPWLLVTVGSTDELILVMTKWL